MENSPGAEKAPRQGSTPNPRVEVTEADCSVAGIIETFLEQEIEKARTRTTYRVQVHLGPDKGVWKGLIVMFRRSIDYDGASATGDSDASLMWCTGCDKVIPPEQIVQRVGFCSHCMLFRNGARGQMADAIQFRFASPRPLAEKVYEILRSVGMDADVMVIRSKKSFRDASSELFERGKYTSRFERLTEKAKEAMDAAIYKRDRLVEDSCSGKDPVKCLEGFLRA